MFSKKDIVLCIVLHFITCGLYDFVWFVTLTDDSNYASEEPTASGGLALLYTLLTCGIYGVYWIFKLGDKIDVAKTRRGVPISNTGLVYLLLSLFGFYIVAFALAQSELNKMAD